MKNSVFSYIVASVAFCVLPAHSSEFGSDPQLFDSPQSPKVRKIVIDAGHGGKDAGSLGKYCQEKDVALSIALKVGNYIKENLPDVTVVYTRKDDTFYALHERAQKANDAKADVFLSIHCNSAPPIKKHIQGTETYVMGLHTAEENLEVAKRENDVVLLEDNYKKNYGGFDPNSPEAHIMLSMYQNAYLEQSLMLAEKIDDQFRNRVQRPSRGVKQAGFMVLRATAMPSVLVETGFLSNSDEEAYLRSEKGQVYLASAIYRAFKEYKVAIEGGELEEDNTPIAQPEVTNPNNKGVVFKIQLASASSPLDIYSGNWKKVPLAIQQEKVENLYKYVVGSYGRLEDAAAQQTQIRTLGFPDAFIVSYQNGKRIPLATAKQLLGIK